MIKKIYTITTLNLDDPSKSKLVAFPYTIKRKRCIGWYSKLKDAKETLENNWTSLDECGYYTLAVIEAFGEGLYGGTKTYDEIWYKLKNNKWIEIDKPKCFDQVIHFGIG